MSLGKKFLTFVLVLRLLLPSLAFAQSFATILPFGEPFTTCNDGSFAGTLTQLCNNIDDVVCADVPSNERRSCSERDRTIIHPQMTSSEVFNFAKGCLKSAAESFVKFFTEFIPELCKAVWTISKEMYNAINPGFFNSLKGAYESAKSIASDVYEAVTRNPGGFFSNLWTKISDAISPMITHYDCLSPQAKVEKICGVAAEFVMPPILLAKIIVKGSKGAKELISAKLASKKGNSELKNALEAQPTRTQFSYSEYQSFFNQYKDLGYTREDFHQIRLSGKLDPDEIKNLKPLSTTEGKAQYERLLGKKYEETLTPAVTPSSTPLAGSVQLQNYKKLHGQELKLATGANQDFIAKMAADRLAPKKNALYFDVENSVQKKLNDSVFIDKSAVDALNNSFAKKLNENLHNNPLLKSRLDGEYKDYKSYRLRLALKEGDDPEVFKKLLAELYEKTNNEFSKELSDLKITQMIPPRNDGLHEANRWFLAGMGDDALEANMSARAARNTKGNPSLAHFSSHTKLFNNELKEIEQLRRSFNRPDLLKYQIVEQAANGQLIPSKSMINILRKTKPEDYITPEEYVKAIQKKSKDIFGTDLKDQEIANLTNYFKKVDSLSPPLFSTERVLINLGEAKNGIVSVDFAGIGVDNIYEQMKGLAGARALQSNPQGLQRSFQNLQEGVDKVTLDMDLAKKNFSDIVAKTDNKSTNSPLFSGDDGIFMPQGKSWGSQEKLALVQELSQSADPSKYRVTFVSGTYRNGKEIPASERSLRIVRAESIEKNLRSAIIGTNKISELDSKKIITAIDYAPDEKGGIFNLIISGKNLDQKEKDLILASFKSVLAKENGEKFGKVIFN